LSEYELFVERYRRKDKSNPAGNYTMLARMTTGLTGWHFGLNGFRILAKLTPWPALYGGKVVNGNDRLVGAIVDYEATTEGKDMIAKARAEAVCTAASVRVRP
jgi:hypothetical protein